MKMKTRIAIFLVLFFISSLLCISYISIAKFAKYEFFESTAVVHIISEGDDSNNSCTVNYGTCTAVAFAKNGHKYQFFTDAHCVADYKKEISKTVLKKFVLHLILEKLNGDELVYEAKVLAIGEMNNFEDFAILEAEIDGDIPLMPLSESRPELNEEIQVVANPVELSNVGLLQLKGYVSKENMGNLIIQSTGVKTKGAFGIQVIGLGTGFGSSGGGVFSVKRGAIIGIINGTVFNSQLHVSLLVSPIAKFNNFYKEYKEGKRPLIDHEQIEPKKGDDQNLCTDPNWCPLKRK